MTRNEATEIIETNFVSQFRDCMELSKLSQVKLSEITGIPLSTMKRYLTGEMPPVSAAIALADALGVSVELLMTGEER